MNNYKLNKVQMGDVPCTYADISKAGNDLNYNPEIKLKDGLREVYLDLHNKFN